MESTHCRPGITVTSNNFSRAMALGTEAASILEHPVYDIFVCNWWLYGGPLTVVKYNAYNKNAIIKCIRHCKLNYIFIWIFLNSNSQMYVDIENTMRVNKSYFNLKRKYDTVVFSNINQLIWIQNLFDSKLYFANN